MLTSVSFSLALLVSGLSAGSLAAFEGARDAERVVEQSQQLTAPQRELTSFLERTIERGAPLYNAGAPQACAAVYATALEAIAGSQGWGIDEQQRGYLATRLEMIAALEQPSDRAWAYRRLIDSLLNGEAISAPGNADNLVLFDFSDRQDADNWRIVLDGVMGGRSTGRLEWQQNTLVFTGETSLENNGGFSSIRAPVPTGSVAGFNALRIRVMGDGRTWILGASNRSGMRGDSFWTRFETREGEWLTVTVPINQMVRQYFGTPINGTLRPSALRGVEFYIYDKQAGPFMLKVDRIEAVRQ